jgi:hypothetical protein
MEIPMIRALMWIVLAFELALFVLILFPMAIVVEALDHTLGRRKKESRHAGPHWTF